MLHQSIQRKFMEFQNDSSDLTVWCKALHIENVCSLEISLNQVKHCLHSCDTDDSWVSVYGFVCVSLRFPESTHRRMGPETSDDAFLTNAVFFLESCNLQPYHRTFQHKTKNFNKCQGDNFPLPQSLAKSLHPYHPWGWYIYLHENHKNQPFM